MQVFKAFFQLLRRNLGTVIMYVSIFLSITIVLSNVATKDTFVGFSDEQAAITVIDRDGGALASGLTDYLYGRNKPFPLPDEQEALQDALFARDTAYILFIPSGWQPQEQGAQALSSAQVPGSSRGVYVDIQVSRYVATLNAYLSSGLPPAEAAEAAGADLSRQVEVRMLETASQENESMYFYFNLLPYPFLMIMIFGLSPVLMAFERRAVAMRMNASALPLRAKNGGLALGSLVLALGCYAVFFAIALAMYGKALLTPEGGLLMANALMFLLLSVSIALLLALVSRSMGVLSALGNVIGLSLCFLGGVYVPLEFLGESMQTITKFMPTYWYVVSLERISGMGAAFAGGLLRNLGMQALFTAAFASLALAVSRMRQSAPLA